MATSKALAEQSKKSGIMPEQVRSAIDKVIKNGAIKSDRHKRFLSYIIEESLTGHGVHILRRP